MVGFYCCVYEAYTQTILQLAIPHDMILSPVTLDLPNVGFALDCHTYYYLDIFMDSVAYLANELVTKAIESVCK